jgi:hypothetical protein
MKNLAEFAQDRHAKEVFSALNNSLTNAANNPLLKKLHEGTMSLREFGFTAKVRLDAATNFIPFLSATEEKTKKDGGWNDMTSALRGNLNEELGLEKGTYDIEEDHETWRNRFRSGLERVLHAEGISLGEIDDRDTTHDVGVFYGERLKKMPVERSVPALAGAFTVLEGVLEKEFSAILAYIKSRLKGFASEELKYVAHHAGHEHRHFDEAAIPLLQKCTLSPHIVPNVIEGIREMEKLRLCNVLECIDMNLWRAEPKK